MGVDYTNFDGKLRASRWLDGPKKMEKLHTDWAEKMAPYGLLRGSKKSNSKHIDIRTYYSAVNGMANSQESIAREMSRRAASAKRKAEIVEQQIADAQAREAKSKLVFDALSQIEQEQAAKRFTELQAATPSPSLQKALQATPKPSLKPFPSTQKHLRPS